MLHGQRGESPAINFDPLTDTITNLAGALVLVVVLVLAMSRASPIGYPPLPPPDDPRERPVEPLLVQMEMIWAATRQTTARVQALQAGLEQLEPRVQRLLNSGVPSVTGHASATPLRSGSAAAPGRGITSSCGGCTLTGGCGSSTTVPFRCGVALGAILFAEMQPAHTPGGSPGGAAAQLSSEPRRLVGILDASIRQTDQQLAQLSARSSSVRQQMLGLYDKVRSIRSPDQGKETTQGDRPVQKLKYRPPMEEFTTSNTLVFVCEEGTVSFIDFGPAQRRVKEILARKASSKQSRPLVEDPPNGDFRIAIGFAPGENGASRTPVFLAMRKPGRRGETWKEAQSERSRFHDVLKRHGPSAYYVSFHVRPDSYEVFRQARQAAWNKGFEVGWVPRPVGEALSFGLTSLVRVQR